MRRGSRWRPLGAAPAHQLILEKCAHSLTLGAVLFSHNQRRLTEHARARARRLVAEERPVVERLVCVPRGALPRGGRATLVRRHRRARVRAGTLRTQNACGHSAEKQGSSGGALEGTCTVPNATAASTAATTGHAPHQTQARAHLTAGAEDYPVRRTFQIGIED